MRIPLTRYGLPEVVVYPAAILAMMAAVGLFGPMIVPVWSAILADGVLALVLVWALMFFRDPHRQTPQDDRLWLAPADGTIMDVERVDEPAFIGGPALRIGIFLSIFNTHINRSPCDARVEKITYRKGKFVNAMNPLAGKINESNDLAMVRLSSRVPGRSSLVSGGVAGATPCGCPGQAQGPDSGSDHPRATSDKRQATRFVVRQVSGAIARRIVCAAREGQQLAQGQRFGMIKFGSRTELYVPANEGIECIVRVGDKVQAGITPVARYITT
jgi:phosphatidylserine decarboxylase